MESARIGKRHFVCQKHSVVCCPWSSLGFLCNFFHWKFIFTRAIQPYIQNSSTKRSCKSRLITLFQFIVKLPIPFLLCSHFYILILLYYLENLDGSQHRQLPHLLQGVLVLLIYYSRVQNKHTPMLINFLTFFQGLRPYSGLHRAYLSNISKRYKWSYAYSFCQIFQGLCLFKGVRLFRTLE